MKRGDYLIEVNVEIKETLFLQLTQKIYIDYDNSGRLEYSMETFFTDMCFYSEFYKNEKSIKISGELVRWLYDHYYDDIENYVDDVVSGKLKSGEPKIK
jgi:hypothetical protein